MIPIRIGSVTCLFSARIPITPGGCQLGEQIPPPGQNTINPYTVLEELAPGLAAVYRLPRVLRGVGGLLAHRHCLDLVIIGPAGEDFENAILYERRHPLRYGDL